MKFKLIYLILALVIVSVALIGYKLKTTEGGKMAKLALEVELDASVFHSGSAIRVAVSIKNIGHTDVVVNKRMSVNFLGAPEGFKDVTFNITGPSGETVPFIARINIRPVVADDFFVLTPGKAISRFYDIEELYHLKNIGVYSVFAVYQNTVTPADDSMCWTGEIISNTISFEIVP